jgi:hypothetical protein
MSGNLPTAAVYCPGLDPEMQGGIDALVYWKWVDKADVHVGGGRSLGNLDEKKKLYLLCHGHGAMPLFCTKAGRWTAAQLADLMMTDGLKAGHREIEMLVCHAGESITTNDASEQRMAIYHQHAQAKAQGNNAAMQKLEAKFMKVVAQGPGPAVFSHADQVIPLCAQFIDALKQRGLTNIRVTAYKAAVSQAFDGSRQVYLVFPNAFPTPATEQDTVRWL